MARYEFRMPRLFLDADLAADSTIDLDSSQLNYLLNVLRLRDGAVLGVFNGREGEWRAELDQTGRRSVRLRITDRMRPQTPPGDLWYCFAPLKTGRLDYMTQKAVEMGASRLVPVKTAHGQVARLNSRRMAANAVEAAEQCGILNLPDIVEIQTLDRLLDDWDEDRSLILCDEGEDAGDPLAQLNALQPGPLAVLVGPEGGFSQAERDDLRRRPFVRTIGLGPRILRADTAAVAALALVQASLGDWR